MREISRNSVRQNLSIWLRSYRIKARKPKIAIVDDDNGQVPQPQKPTRRNPRIKPPKPNRPPLPMKEHITDVPSSKIKELNQALNGHAKSYGIELQDNLNPLNHFTKTKVLVKSHLEDLLKTMKEFKFIETLDVTLEKELLRLLI